MAHEKRIVTCQGPEDAHAFDGIAVQRRRGKLDAKCPKCRGHGQWNGQIDLNSHRSIRVICECCDGAGWVETGDDMVALHAIERSPEGYPQWVVKLARPGDDQSEMT